MDVFEKSLALIDKYLTETDVNVIQEELSRYDSMNFDGGVTFDEYLTNFAQQFSFDEFNAEDFTDLFSEILFDENKITEEINITFDNFTDIFDGNFSCNVKQEYSGENNYAKAA